MIFCTTRCCPPPSDTEVLQEQFKLDYAIHDFEWSMNEVSREGL
jgi:hypothetical protein